MAGYPLPQRPELPLEAELARLRKRAMRLCSDAHGPALITDKDLLQTLNRLIVLEVRAAADAAELEWVRADACSEAAGSTRMPTESDVPSREARELAASQLRRQIRRLKQQSSLHVVCAQNWELRAEQLRQAAGKLGVPVAAPVVEAPRSPMLDAIAEVNASMAGGAK
jgi:hypothetical protein